ncbi:hypothetical protein [Actinomycetospora sp. TBRC 11914]|uniref:hypothetical protein n=1 Tax=Actinomycetospora sp. TBRC 11914 TaxID=2729387 RepID=UPI00145E6D16|nr:hypothetical protein [Actinomycetospora sp. TBRC 11914]NMO92500.1 hypothetical protein [Actinomycetospora sp. TBRC 11914]
MTIPPSTPGRRPTSGLDPMPPRHPLPPLPGDPPDDRPAHELPDDVPDPTAPGMPSRRPEVPTPGRTTLVAAGRDDRYRHVVEVAWGDAVDPQGLRAWCGAAVEAVVPGLGADQADCPDCRGRLVTAARP